MKITQGTPPEAPFAPITITLETRAELHQLFVLLNHCDNFDNSPALRPLWSFLKGHKDTRGWEPVNEALKARHKVRYGPKVLT